MSAWCTSRVRPKWRASQGLALAGRTVTRSRSPLPPRTTSWLRPKSMSFTRSLARAVEKCRHQLGYPVELSDHRCHFLPREDDRHPGWPARADQLVEPWNVTGQQARDLGRAQLHRVPPAAQQDDATDPTDSRV